MSAEPVIEVRPGVGATVLGAAIPVVAVSLVAWRAAVSGLDAGPDDPASPWIIAVLTILVACWLGWRAVTQHAELRVADLRSRNLTTTFDVEWERVEDMQVLRRGPVTVVEVRIRGLRRRMRIGAATRWSAESAVVVLDVLRAHPVASTLLVDPLDDL